MHTFAGNGTREEGRTVIGEIQRFSEGWGEEKGWVGSKGYIMNAFILFVVLLLFHLSVGKLICTSNDDT